MKRICGIRRGCVVIAPGQVDDASVMDKFTVTSPVTDAEVCAAAKLSDGSVAIPRYCAYARDMSITIAEPISLGAQGSNLTWNSTHTLRPSQAPGVADVFNTLIAEHGCTMRGDTGSGKTVMAIKVAHMLQPRRTVILVDQLDLADQWADRLKTYLVNPTIRRFTAGKLATIHQGNPGGGTFVIVTAQTLYRSATFTPDKPIVCDLLLCDEVHVFGAPTFLQSLFRINYRYSLAMTATVNRRDKLERLFLDCLGPRVVEVQGDVMPMTLLPVLAPTCGEVEADWITFWCKKIRGQAHVKKCQACEQFEAFPDCAGMPKIPTDKKKQRIQRSGLVQAITGSAEYVAWAVEQLSILIRKGRKIIVFSPGKVGLIAIHDEINKIFGPTTCGLFFGGGKKGDAGDRSAALSRQVTCATLAVAAKGLDTVEKDLAFFLVPVADATQAAGRTRRVKVGKSDPISVVAVPDLPTFHRTWFKMAKRAKELRWRVVSLST